LLRQRNEATGASRALLSETISFEQAVDLAASSVKEAFPASRCSKPCLVRQIEDYYKKLCNSTAGSMPLKDPKGNAKYDIPDTTGAESNNTGSGDVDFGG